jgi:hypothetical protein
LIPVLEQTVFAYLKRIPPDFELTRTLRYLIPLILLAAFSVLWTARKRVQQKNAMRPSIIGNLFIASSLVLLLAWGLRGVEQRREFRSVVRQNLTCWSQAKMICPLPQASMDFIAVMDAVREMTPLHAHIFSEGQEVAVRYYALRPLMYTYKDGAPLAYTDTAQLLVWNEHYEEMNHLGYIRQFPFRRNGFVRGIVELALDADAEYLILWEPYDPDLFYPDTLGLLYTNQTYSLYTINP